MTTRVWIGPPDPEFIATTGDGLVAVTGDGAEPMAEITEYLDTGQPVVAEGRPICDARAHLCRCAKDAGHVEAGDPVHGCHPDRCTGQWSGIFDNSKWDGGKDWEVVRMPRPVGAPRRWEIE